MRKTIIVTLEAKPAAEYSFVGWSDTLGAVSGNEKSTDFFVAGDHVITAQFAKAWPVCYRLTASAQEGGTISFKAPNGECFEVGAYYKAGSIFTVTAVPDPGFKFNTWSGDVMPGTILTQPSFDITMDMNRTITADFDKACQPLELVDPSGEGAPIAASPTHSIGCEAGSYTYLFDQAIVLTAEPAAGWKVTSWDFDPAMAASTSETYNLTMPKLEPGASLQVQVNYREKATFEFNTDFQSFDENAGTVDIVVVRKPGTLPDAANIAFTTVDGTAKNGPTRDYLQKIGTLSFAENELSKTIPVTIVADNKAESPESFSIVLSKPTPEDDNYKLGTLVSTEVQITENAPTIGFEPRVYTVGESEGSIELTVAVSPLPKNDHVYIDFKTEDGTAVAGEDYEAINDGFLRIRVPDGQEEVSFRVTITPDAVDEPDEETIHLFLTDVSENALLPVKENPADPDAIIKIVDDDNAPTVGFSESEYFVNKLTRNAATIPVVTTAASEREVEIDYTVILERTGATVQQGTVKFEGAETKNLEVSTGSAVADDVLTLQLSNPLNAVLGINEAGPYNTAKLYVLPYGSEDCHDLRFTYGGYGQAPAAANKTNSLGCPSGQYVAGELIDIAAQPDQGWYVDRWQGTIDDESTSTENAVKMPDEEKTVNAFYRVPIYFAVVNTAQDKFLGPEEAEPNNLFSQANGPIQFGTGYLGSFEEQSDKNDLYYFLLGQETDVVITLTDIPNNRDYDLVLYDESWIDGESVASSRAFDNNPEKIEITLPPGKYYLQVYAGTSDPSTEQYRLRVVAK